MRIRAVDWTTRLVGEMSFESKVSNLEFRMIDPPVETRN